MLGICYQNVLTATHLASNGASPPCNPLTNVHAATTPFTSLPAVTHLLLNSNHAAQTRRKIDT